MPVGGAPAAAPLFVEALSPPRAPAGIGALGALAPSSRLVPSPALFMRCSFAAALAEAIADCTAWACPVGVLAAAGSPSLAFEQPTSIAKDEATETVEASRRKLREK